jgi:hypothetical protein
LKAFEVRSTSSSAHDDAVWKWESLPWKALPWRSRHRSAGRARSASRCSLPVRDRPLRFMATTRPLAGGSHDTPTHEHGAPVELRTQPTSAPRGSASATDASSSGLAMAGTVIVSSSTSNRMPAAAVVTDTAVAAVALVHTRRFPQAVREPDGDVR